MQLGNSSSTKNLPSHFLNHYHHFPLNLWLWRHGSCNSIQDGFRQMLCCFKSKYRVIPFSIPLWADWLWMYIQSAERQLNLVSARKVEYGCFTDVLLYHMKRIFCNIFQLLIYSLNLFLAFFLVVEFMPLLSLQKSGHFSATSEGIYHIKKERWACGCWSVNRDAVREIKVSITRSLTSEKAYKYRKEVSIHTCVCI